VCALLPVGVKLVEQTVSNEQDPTFPLLYFSEVSSNVQELVVVANVSGLEPLLPKLQLVGGAKQKHAHHRDGQKKLLGVVGTFNLTMVDSVVLGVPPLITDSNGLNPAMPQGAVRASFASSYRLEQSISPWDSSNSEAAREAREQ
jgi:hypothetical protein